MFDMIAKEIRIDAQKLMLIRQLMADCQQTNESAFLRELIDIGYVVKKAQHEQLDNDGIGKAVKEEDVANWQAVYQDAAKKMIECHHLIRQIFAFSYNAKQSNYDAYGVELNENKRLSDEYIDALLSEKIDSEKLKSAKGK